MISIIIRTLNEEKYLSECLERIRSQVIDDDLEIILVDSGSTDETICIARKYELIIREIKKEDFTFGRSLNLGCLASQGSVLVFLSAHCIPYDRHWLKNLVAPLKSQIANYSYGRQIARDGISKFSEGRIFAKYYPEHSSVPQAGYFCNNANSAILRETWMKYKFDESLSGLEDMELAKRIVENNGKIAYVADATVEHIHEESWRRIKIRFEREALALGSIEPRLSLQLSDAIGMCFVSILKDIKEQRAFNLKSTYEIIAYRACQYFGSYIGSSLSKSSSKTIKRSYFYPEIDKKPVTLEIVNEGRSFIANEGKQ